ncbi:MAG: hypothetical protein LWW86_01265 [Micrococcales bacterium]|nr:hypothetical protein [Micrococcales bacterium]
MPKVDTSAIRTHAAAVSGLAGQLGQMQDAADVAGDGFGILLGWLPGVINAANGDVTGAYQQAQQALTETAAGLRSMAQQYDDDDANAAFTLQGMMP